MQQYLRSQKVFRDRLFIAEMVAFILHWTQTLSDQQESMTMVN